MSAARSMHSSPRKRLLIAACTSLLLAACAQPTAFTNAHRNNNHWRGRLALQIEREIDSTGEQSLSAGFELQGSPRQGQLRLYSPLGNTVALLQWHPGGALLDEGQKRRTFPSLQALMQEFAQHAGGAELPVAALFDWLGGQATQTSGWHVDLHAWASRKRITATRHTPTPRVVLRVVLD